MSEYSSYGAESRQRLQVRTSDAGLVRLHDAVMSLGGRQEGHGHPSGVFRLIPAALPPFGPEAETLA